MTETALRPAPTATVPAGRPNRARLIICWATVAAILPYLTLKIIWLFGNAVGLSDPKTANNSALHTLNAFTFGMDAVALFSALMLTYDWGLRVPAWLPVFPMWVGTGFLAPIVLTLPLQLAVSRASNHHVTSSTDIVHPWVYAVVYSGFFAQGIGLMTAFVLYCRTRWPHFIRARISATPMRPLVVGMCVLAVPVAAAHLYWACGGTAGLSHYVVTHNTAEGHVLDAVFVALGIAAIAGAVMLLRGITTRPAWLPIVTAWVGTAAMFAWGMYGVIVDAVGAPLNKAGHQTAVQLTDYLGSITGALLAVGVLFLLVSGDSTA